MINARAKESPERSGKIAQLQKLRNVNRPTSRGRGAFSTLPLVRMLRSGYWIAAAQDWWAPDPKDAI